MTSTRRHFLGASAAALAGCATPRSTSPAMQDRDTPDAEERTSEMEALFSDLEDQSVQFEPIREDERAPRRQRLGHLLGEAGIDALVMEAGATMTYLSGVNWGRSERLFALVVLADGSHFWLAPHFEAARAEGRTQGPDRPGGALVTWHEHEYAALPLARALEQRSVQRVAIEPRLRWFAGENLAQAFGGQVVSGQGVLRALRGTKDERELALMRAANEITQRAIRIVAQRLRPGLTDLEIGAWMRHAQERMGLTGTWVLSLLNEDAALPHGAGGGKLLSPGDLILVDTGGALHGYQSDNTRTWVFDRPPAARIERAWNCVRDAQKRAFETIAPGVPCRAVDAAARSTPPPGR